MGAPAVPGLAINESTYDASLVPYDAGGDVANIVDDEFVPNNERTEPRCVESHAHLRHVCLRRPNATRRVAWSRIGFPPIR
jgi:hypothetical protein